MRIVCIFLFLFLSACSIYTLTNKTDQDLKVIIAGGDTLNLEAGKCIELVEYFMGLGGDFPFIIKGEDVERSAGNYEINTSTVESASGNPDLEADASVAKGYNVSLSDKNISCEPEEEKSGTTEEASSLEPVCEDGTEVNCHSSTAKCEAGEDSPICVDEKGEKITGVTPTCSDTSKKPVCREKSSASATGLETDSSAKAICLSGTIQCSNNARVQCAKINGKLIPTCVGAKGQTDGSISCAGVNVAVVRCVQQEVQVTSVTNFTLSCDISLCADEGRPVCGRTPTDNTVKPYCINDRNILWPSEVSCADGSAPTCR